MEKKGQLAEQRLADAWAELQSHSDQGHPLEADAYRLAFADPEFLLRRETRGIRFQLEMLKPDVDQAEQGIDNTIVVFGSARFLSPEDAHTAFEKAQISADLQAMKVAQRQVKNAHYYDQARLFARIVGGHSAHHRRPARLVPEPARACQRFHRNGAMGVTVAHTQDRPRHQIRSPVSVSNRCTMPGKGRRCTIWPGWNG